MSDYSSSVVFRGQGILLEIPFPRMEHFRTEPFPSIRAFEQLECNTPHSVSVVDDLPQFAQITALPDVKIHFNMCCANTEGNVSARAVD